MSRITIIWREASLFSRFSLATEWSNDSSTLYIYNTKRACYDMKFLCTVKELSGIPLHQCLPLVVAHCSWCSQFIVAGITRCSVTHTALCDNVSGHKCFPSKPEVLNTTWNQLLTCVVPEKCSELKKPKEFWSSLPRYSYFFLVSSFTIQRFTVHEQARPIDILYMKDDYLYEMRKKPVWFPPSLCSIFKCLPQSFQTD